MDLEQLAQIHKEYAKQTEQMMTEFYDLFHKWLKINPRLSLINMIHLPMSLIMSSLVNNDVPVTEVFPELPDVFIRFMKPLESIKDKWGKIPNEEFERLYREKYEAQFFDKLFSTEKEKKQFDKWFKGKNPDKSAT